MNFNSGYRCRRKKKLKCSYCKQNVSICNVQKFVTLKFWNTSSQKHFLCIFPHCNNVNTFSLFSKEFLEATFLLNTNIIAQCASVVRFQLFFYCDKKKLISNIFSITTDDILFELRESCFKLEQLFWEKKKTRMCYINTIKCSVYI